MCPITICPWAFAPWTVCPLNCSPLCHSPLDHLPSDCLPLCHCPPPIFPQTVHPRLDQSSLDHLPSCNLPPDHSPHCSSSPGLLPPDWFPQGHPPWLFTLRPFALGPFTPGPFALWPLSLRPFTRLFIPRPFAPRLFAPGAVTPWPLTPIGPLDPRSFTLTPFVPWLFATGLFTARLFIRWMFHILGPLTCLSRMGNWSKDQYIYFMSCTQNMGYNTRQNNASTWHYDQHKSLINVVICLHTRRNSWASSVSTNTFEDIWSIQYETYILNFLSWKHKESSYHKRLFF